MMLLDTTDEWAGCALTVQFGADVDTYAAPSARNAYDVLDGLQAWSMDAARPWTSKILSWLTTSRDDVTGGATFKIAGSASFSLGANATAQALLGLPASSLSVLTITTSAPLAGSWCPGRMVLRRDVSVLEGKGQSSGIGAIRPGIPSTTCRRPHLVVSARALDLGRLAVVMASAAHPRAVWLRDALTAEWSRWALVDAKRTAGDGVVWRVEVGLLGEVS